MLTPNWLNARKESPNGGLGREETGRRWQTGFFFLLTPMKQKNFTSGNGNRLARELFKRRRVRRNRGHAPSLRRELVIGGLDKRVENRLRVEEHGNLWRW